MKPILIYLPQFITYEKFFFLWFFYQIYIFCQSFYLVGPYFVYFCLPENMSLTDVPLVAVIVPRSWVTMSEKAFWVNFIGMSVSYGRVITHPVSSLVCIIACQWLSFSEYMIREREREKGNMGSSLYVKCILSPTVPWYWFTISHIHLLLQIFR